MLRIVQDLQLVGDNLDFAGFDVRVDSVRIALLALADHGDDILRAQLAGFLVQRRIQLGVEHDLRDPGAVAHVDEDQAAQVAPPVYPAHEHHALAGVGGAQLAAACGCVADRLESRASCAFRVKGNFKL